MRCFIFKIFIFTLVVFSLNSRKGFAVETCSRIAIINYQEVLVDSNATEKGEGLRYNLEKDAVAKNYLDIYQKNSDIRWPNAILGSIGSGLILYGFFNPNSVDSQIFLVSGLTAILVNFLVAKTLEMSNETNLTKAIEEYNKRNLPKIYFNPEGNSQGNIPFPGFKIALTKDWSF